MGQVAATSPEPACEVGPGHVEVVEERGNRAGLLEDSEVGANDVLDQRSSSDAASSSASSTRRGIVCNPAIR